MKQVVSRVKSGEISIEELQDPALRKGFVLVQVFASVISAGTERASVSDRKQSLLQKARKNPDLVAKVLQDVRSRGLASTYQRVKGRLESFGGMGYSAAGRVVQVGDGVTDIAVGDLVACAGAAYANHAETIVVPKNLCARIPAGVELTDAAYTTIASIALQGIRQAEVSLGESVAVIGLGLVGQLTLQMLKASGCVVFGIDPDKAAVKLARTSGADAAFARSDDIKSLVQHATAGIGADAVIITAATSSEDPIELAGLIARDRGKVVLVGDVGLKIPRAPYYMKELDFRLSRSYGPGRYDPEYEEGGKDYPVGYVRWTERRNMEEVLRLMKAGRLRPSLLTTHTYPLEKAQTAFGVIAGTGASGGKRPFGVVLTYSPKDRKAGARKKDATIQAASGEPGTLGFIGAGSFAQSTLLPPLKALEGVVLRSVCTATGVSAENIKRQFGFSKATTDITDVLGDDKIGTVFIASRHGHHANQVMAALRAGKHVFVEKPLTMLPDELEELVSLHASLPDRDARVVMPGFNRRFAPSVCDLKSFFEGTTAPYAITYRVHAGLLPKGHWTLNPEEGGGRIVGEVCHFVDTIQYLTGSRVERVYAERVGPVSATMGDDSVSIMLKCADGSMATIMYLANGDPSVPKEYIEMYGGGRTAMLDNFSTLTRYTGSKKTERAWSTVDKGHGQEMRETMQAVKNGTGSPIAFADAVAVTRTTFRIEESLRRGTPVAL